MANILRKSLVLAAAGAQTLVAPAAAVSAGKPNPIRRVVTLLQEMAKEIETEVEKEKKSMEKFMCYCKKNDGTLSKKAEEAAQLIKKTKAQVESLTAQKKQLAEDLKKHKKDREESKKSLAAAIKKRTEEKKKYDEATKEQKETLVNIDKAITALQKGLGKSFLQTSAAESLRAVVDGSAAAENLDVELQEGVLAFLQGKATTTGGASEIVGILKQMKDNFDESLGGIVKEEEEAVALFEKVKGELGELIKAASASIEKKSELKGEVAVQAVEGKNLVKLAEKQMGDDMATLAELKEACAGKGTEFETRQKDAAAEVDAINQAIGVLNNDDALDLFKKTDTKAEFLDTSSSTSTSFLQVRTALVSKGAALDAARQLDSIASSGNNKAVALLAYTASHALSSKSGAVDFSKIMTMIDEMIVTLKSEGENDLKMRDQCNADFNSAAAEKKETEHTIAGLSAQIEELTEVIAANAAVMKKSAEDIAAAKEAMAEATEQRTKDNASYIEAVDLNKQAVDLIEKAKNKLNAYYNPQLVTPEPAAEEEEGAALLQKLPEGAPETFSGARKNKGGKGASVLAILATMQNDINNDSAALEKDEALAQQEYEKLSGDLAQQVADSTTAATDAGKAKSEAEDGKQTAESTLSMKEEELADVKQTIADLHASCDFILKTFEERKTARENEISGLGKAKAILAGAKLE